MRTSLTGFGLVLALAGCHVPQQHGSDVSADRASLESARAALADGEAGTSLGIAHGILAAHPNDPDALAQAGDAEVTMGDRLNGERDYRHAMQLDPRNVRARVGMAKLLLRDDVKGAEMAFRAILVDAPRDPVVLNDLGYTLDMQERHAEAQAVYLQGLNVDPLRLSLKVNYALSLALSGQAPRAEQMLRDLAATAGATTRVRLDYALAQVIAGHDIQAKDTLSADLSPGEATDALQSMSQLKTGK